MISNRRVTGPVVWALSCVVLTAVLVLPATPSSATGRSGTTTLAPHDSAPGLCTIDNIDAAGGVTSSNWECGATLVGPTSLPLSKCPTSGVIGDTNQPITAQVLKQYLCTPAFTLSLAFSAQPTSPGTDDHGVPPLSLYSAGNTSELIEPGWCPANVTTGVCDAESSVPQRILVPKNSKPASALLSIQGLPNGCVGAKTVTACDYQATLTITLGGTAPVSHPKSSKGPLKVSVSYLQNGKAIVLNPKGKSPQKDTIQLADADTGEVAQDVTLQVKIKNAGKKTQTNVTLNGAPSFSYAKSEVATTNLPLAVTSGPSPGKDIGTLAPGQSSSPITYVVSVTNNGNFVSTVQVLSTNQGSDHNLVSQGSANLTALPTAYLWLSLSRVAPGLVTAGTQVEISGAVTNRSQTQSIDVDPISPITTGNAGGGDLEPTAQTALSDGVILPFAGTLAPGQSEDVEGWVQTAYVPSTRATVTYDPTGSVENADGTETDLTPKQVGLSAGSDEFNIGINTTDPPPPDSNLDTVVDNFTDAVVKGTSIWALNKLQGGLDILQHPVTSATGLAKGVAGFAVGSVQAVGEAASLVSSIYLLGLAANDMSEADRQAWADQIVLDFKQSHLKIASDAAASVYAAVNTWVLTLFNDLDSAYTTGNYNTLASFLGSASASGLTTVEDAMLSDIAFQKFAIGVKYTGQVATNAAKSAAAIATEQGGLANLVSLEAAIRDAKATAVLGKSIDGITAGTNLLLDGAAALVKSFGLTPRQISELQAYCKRENIIVAVRARSAKAAQLIKDGLAVGKNEIIKLKNVNSIDVQFLGYSKHDLNTVVWAQPLTKAEVTSSVAFQAADASTQEIVLARLKIRTKEWHDPSIKSILNTSETTGEISWGFNGADNGVPAANKTAYRGFGLKSQPNPVAAGGAKRTYQQVLVSNKVGGAGIGRLVKVTQDVDLMAVTSANGEILDASQRLAAYEHLSDIIGIEHPETPTYIKNGEFLFENKVKYLADVTPGGEPLAIFSFTGAVTAGFFDPALTIFDTATHQGRIFFQGAYNDPYSTLKTKIALNIKSAAQ